MPLTRIEPGLLTPEQLTRVYTPVGAGGAESPWSFGWIVGHDETGGRTVRITGGNPGLQAGLIVYPDHRLAVAAVSNSWGIGSRNGEMINVERFARRCMGWPDP